MWIFTEPFFEYLKARSTWQKILDMVLVIVMFTVVAVIYTVANNYTAIRQTLFVQKTDMRASVQLDTNINEILSYAMQTGNFDRAALARFHDSVTDFQGRHFVYESRSNEVVTPGVAPIASMRQNILISMINIWAQSFIKNECVYTTNLSSTDLFYEFYRQTGTKSDIKCPVFNTQGIWVGYLMLESTSRALSTDELKAKEPMVRDAANKIGAILSLQSD